jgi:tRNA 2-thiouridine synthesizing protein A
MTKSSPSSSPPTSSSPGDASAGDASAGDASTGATAMESLNLCGELCPFTFVRTKLTLEALPMGALLRVIVDHEPAIRNIPRSAAEWGQEVIGVARLSPDTWAIDLRKRVR